MVFVSGSIHKAEYEKKPQKKLLGQGNTDILISSKRRTGYGVQYLTVLLSHSD